MAPSQTPVGPSTDQSPSILLVDDDVKLCELMVEFFAEQRIFIETAHDGPRGLSKALGGGYDLLILDVMIPGLDGVELLRRVRGRSVVPVIMLTARTAKADRLKGLDAGADDYIPKPFDPDELLARARAVLRRFARGPRNVVDVEVDGLRLVPSAREVYVNGSLTDLTTVEYDILEFLARSAGRIVTREELTAALYRRRPSPFDRAIDVHVSRLRKKLGVHGDRIRTVRGVGYLLSPARSIGEAR